MGDFLRFAALAVLGLDHLPVQVEALSVRLKLVEGELRQLRDEAARKEARATVRGVPPPVARLVPPGRKSPRGAR